VNIAACRGARTRLQAVQSAVQGRSRHLIGHSISRCRPHGRVDLHRDASRLAALERAKGQRPLQKIPYHLLFWLYGALGHDRKADIARVCAKAMRLRKPIERDKMAELDPLLARLFQRLDSAEKNLPAAALTAVSNLPKPGSKQK